MADPFENETPAQAEKRIRETRERLARHDELFGVRDRTDAEIRRSLFPPKEGARFTAGDPVGHNDAEG